MTTTNNQYRAIPQLQVLLETAAANALCREYSRQETVTALRLCLNSIRKRIGQDGNYQLPDFHSAEFFNDIRKEILRQRERSLQPVINATGIILHTNLGRAPIATVTIDAIRDTALGYSNLEFNLATGKRGSRFMHIERILQQITGAEAAVVVNNCAAAVLVSLNTLAKGREVIVSRGELIEIGGGFRMPDVIAATGAILREVGTTNKTRLADFERAINENTGVILSNHCSNYSIVGFTECPDLQDLVALAHKHNLYMVQDLGSGALLDLSVYGIKNERSAQQILKDGIDLVMFSGDKLLGGPQAGIIVGRSAPIEAIKKNPLMRALRIDKLSLAALEATLNLYLAPELAMQQVPILKMLSEDPAAIKKRSQTLARQLNKLDSITARVENDVSYVGGGSAPMNELPTWVIRIASAKHSSEEISKLLRLRKPAVIGRIASDKFVLDLRTVFPEQVSSLREAFASLA
ncbi:MAG: selA [Gammaproteobacteria bacterium]|nr:selA [Gammaproteobacteria bacterium]